MTGPIFLIAGDPTRRGRGQDPLLTAIVARLGLARPKLAYVGAASGDNRLFFLWIAALLKRAGAGSVRLASLASRRADPGRARRILEAADIVFVSGGDVELGMRILQATGMIETLRALLWGGMPFIGLSAGSIMLAQSWVRWRDENDDATAEAFPCLGLAPLLCDTHAEEEGWQELRVLLRLSGAPLGYGIPAGGALAVSAAGSLQALGRPVPQVTLTGGLPDLDLERTDANTPR